MEPLAKIETARSYIKSYRDTDDPFLNLLLRACSDRIRNYTGRSFVPEPALAPVDPLADPVVYADTAPPVTKNFRLRGTSRFVNLPDLRELTSITFGGIAILSTPGNEGYVLWGKEGRPYTAVELDRIAVSPFASGNILSVTGRWGYLEVPDDIQDALCMWVARRFKQRDANYADTVTQGIEGAAFSYSQKIPGDIQLTLNEYRSQGTNIALVGVGS